MIPVDIGHVYPKTGLDVDLRVDLTPRFVSTGSLYLPGGNYDDVEVDGLSWTSDGAWSFSCWVKSNDLTTANYKKIFSVYDSVNSHRIDFEAKDDADLRIYLDASSSQPYHDFTGAATRVQDGTWHHLALVATVSSSDNIFKLYIDGQQFGADSSACARADISSADSGYIGNHYGGSSATLTGNLAHVGFWNAALSEAQVRSLMTATTYAEAVTKGGSTPAAYYLFETDADASVGSVDGTLGGSAVIVGDRARLPNGYDLTGTRLDARSASGRCVDFDGSADGMYGTTTYDVNGSGDTTTLSCWFNADSLSGSNATIASNVKANASNSIAIYRTGTNEIAAVAYYAASTHVKVSTGSVLQTGKWYHAVATFDKDSTTVKLYVDGKEYSATPSIGYGGTDNTFEIGFRHLGGGGSQIQHFNGKISDVKMLNIAFTAAQALEQYQNPEQVLPTGATASNLKRWYPLSDFDIAGATNLDGLYMQDASGNGKQLLFENCGMEFSQPNIPQLGLRSSSSRLYFDQDDDKVTVGNNAAIDGLFASGGSIALWVNIFSDGEGTYGRMIETTGYKFFVQSESSGNVQIRFDHTWGTNGTWVGPSASIALGVWNHLVVTYNGSSIENDPVFYVNGSAITVTETVKPIAPINADTADKVFGANSAGDRTTHGIISEIAYYKGTVLDADAVTVMYNSGVQGFDLLTDSGNYDNAADVDGWWKLDNPVTIADLSTNSNTGTVAGSPAMVTVQEGATVDLSSFGTMTSLRPPNGISGVPGIYLTPGRNCAEMPEPAWGTDPFTVACWCYSPQPPVAHTAIWGSGDGDPYVILKFSGATSVVFGAYTSGGTGNTVVATASSSEITNRWFFVCARKHSNTSWELDVMPLDGTPANNTQTTEISTTLTSDGAAGFVVGGWDASDATPFKRGAACDIMDFRIWQGEALTDAQMNALYESGARKARGLTR